MFPLFPVGKMIISVSRTTLLIILSQYSSLGQSYTNLTIQLQQQHTGCSPKWQIQTIHTCDPWGRVKESIHRCATQTLCLHFLTVSHRKQVYFLSSSLLLMARAGSLFWDGLGQLNYSISKCFHYSCQPISCRRMGPYETMWLRLGLLCVYWEVYFTAMCVCNHKLILRQGKRRIRGTRLVKKDLIPSNLPATISWLHRYLPPTWDSCNTTSPCVAIHEN